MSRLDTARPTVQAIITRLKAVLGMSAVWGSPARIYFGEAPQNAAFPFVVVSIQTTPSDTKSRVADDHTVRIQSFARATNSQSPADLALLSRETIINSLDRATFAVTGASMVDCLQTGISDVFVEPDGETWQSIAEFAVRVTN